MPEYIEFLSEVQVKELVNDLEDRLLQGADIFLDNSAICWPIKHMNQANNTNSPLGAHLRTKVRSFTLLASTGEFVG